MATFAFKQALELYNKKGEVILNRVLNETQFHKAQQEAMKLLDNNKDLEKVRIYLVNGETNTELKERSGENLFIVRNADAKANEYGFKVIATKKGA